MPLPSLKSKPFLIPLKKELGIKAALSYSSGDLEASLAQKLIWPRKKVIHSWRLQEIDASRRALLELLKNYGVHNFQDLELKSPGVLQHFPLIPPFALSHTTHSLQKAIGLAAISTQEEGVSLGVDLEIKERPLSHRVQNWKGLPKSDESLSPLQRWCLYESVVKAKKSHPEHSLQSYRASDLIYSRGQILKKTKEGKMSLGQYYFEDLSFLEGNFIVAFVLFVTNPSKA